MTRFIHDQFAKQYLKELLTPLGNVETSRDVAGEVRQVDVLFAPKAEPEVEPTALGILGQIAAQPAVFEPFRSKRPDRRNSQLSGQTLRYPRRI